MKVRKIRTHKIAHAADVVGLTVLISIFPQHPSYGALRENRAKNRERVAKMRERDAERLACRIARAPAALPVAA